MFSVRAIFLWLVVCVTVPAQSREVQQAEIRKFGSIEVSIQDDQLEIRRGAREWHVDISQLPVLATDCDNPTERENCEALSIQSPCVKCIHYPSPIAWDEANESLYFAVATGTSRNRPWIIFRYSLVGNQITRVMADYGAGFEFGTLSPSGRYLAYAAFASNGACGTQNSIKVLDLRSQQSASARYATKNDDEIVLVQSLRWANATALDYSAEIHSEADCRNAATGNYSKRTVTARVEVLRLGFH